MEKVKTGIYLGRIKTVEVVTASRDYDGIVEKTNSTVSEYDINGNKVSTKMYVDGDLVDERLNKVRKPTHAQMKSLMQQYAVKQYGPGSRFEEILNSNGEVIETFIYAGTGEVKAHTKTIYNEDGLKIRQYPDLANYGDSMYIDYSEHDDNCNPQNSIRYIDGEIVETCNYLFTYY